MLISAISPLIAAFGALSTPPSIAATSPFITPPFFTDTFPNIATTSPPTVPETDISPNIATTSPVKSPLIVTSPNIATISPLTVTPSGTSISLNIATLSLLSTLSLKAQSIGKISTKPAITAAFLLIFIKRPPNFPAACGCLSGTD